MACALGFALLLLVTSNANARCDPYDPPESELAQIISASSDVPPGTPKVSNVCIRGMPPIGVEPPVVAPEFRVTYRLTWSPHREIGSLALRWAQHCTAYEPSEVSCSDVFLQGSAYESPWFRMPQHLREEDVISLLRFAQGLLSEDEAILGIDTWPFVKDERWSVKRHGYGVVVGKPGWACQTVYPVRFDCTSDRCQWIVDLIFRARQCT